MSRQTGGVPGEDSEALMLAVPRIETERLILRGCGLADLDPYGAMWGDPDVVRYIGGQPSRRDEIWQRFLRNRGHWMTLGFGYWVMEERASGRLAGEVGFAHFKRNWSPDIEARFSEAPESGWVLPVWAHGQGLATEAVRAIHAWGEEAYGWARTFCAIAEGNTASVRVAEKAGYAEAARTLLNERPTIIMERRAAA